jgi:hypothetical protein
MESGLRGAVQGDRIRGMLWQLEEVASRLVRVSARADRLVMAMELALNRRIG